MKIAEILKKYTMGEISVDDANKALRDAGNIVRIDPKKNMLTADEIEDGTAGLLDTGTGTLDKVKVSGNKLVNYDAGETEALLIIKGNAYRVSGNTIVK